MKKTKIGFIGPNPSLDGGVSILQKNLIRYLANKKYDISWIYPGKKDAEIVKGGVRYIEVKSPRVLFLENVFFNLRASRIIKRKGFDIVNSQGIWRAWGGKKKIVNTYHGTAYYMLRNSSKNFNILKKAIFFPALLFGYFMEKPKKEERIICVSEKVKKQVEKLYGKRQDITVIRTGVDVKKFKPLDMNKARSKVGLNKGMMYGLYVGKGGYWTKGLDRVISLSEEIYNKNKSYRLIVIGSDIKKVKKVIDKEFVIYLKQVDRNKIPSYYNSADVFFCMSRYEGGAPTLVVSEAMASGCFVVCSKDSEQEIIEDGKNGLVLDDFGESGAKKVLEILNNKRRKKELVKNSLRTIRELSLERWGKKYLDVLVKV